MTASAPALSARDLVFDYPGRRALDGVSFAVEGGEIFGFLGPNGSGKSTLFRLLATLLPPQQGEVEIAGRSLRREPDAVRRALGVVFQAPSLDLALTVEENLVLQARLYAMPRRQARAAAERALGRFGLADRRAERVKSLLYRFGRIGVGHSGAILSCGDFTIASEWPLCHGTTRARFNTMTARRPYSSRRLPG